MKTKLLLIIPLIILLSCDSPNAEVEKQLGISNTIGQSAPTGENEEYLDWSSIRVNSKLPLTASVQSIEGLLGKVDSVVSIDWSSTCSSGYRSDESKNAYFGGVEFEQFGDSLDFMHINFSQDQSVFLQSGALKLDHATTLIEVKKHFPNAVKGIGNGYYNIYGKETDAINLPPSKELSDRQWILMFQDGKLIRIDLWTPC